MTAAPAFDPLGDFLRERTVAAAGARVAAADLTAAFRDFVHRHRCPEWSAHRVAIGMRARGVPLIRGRDCHYAGIRLRPPLELVRS